MRQDVSENQKKGGLRIVLASASPRRREILAHLGLDFEVITADTDEASAIREPRALVCELSARKARAVAQRLGFSPSKDASGTEQNEPRTLLIAADTVVSVAGEVLGKPRDRDDAARMLRRLSGRSHEVYTGITLFCDGKYVTDAGRTEVRFAPLAEEEIARYIATGEPDDKAGAYAVQGLAAAYIEGLNGCYFNVMGLPVHLLCTMCREAFGIELPYLAAECRQEIEK